MFQILWQFDTTDERAAAFAEAYGPDGVWVAFFRQAPGYLGTDLFRRERGATVLPDPRPVGDARRL